MWIKAWFNWFWNNRVNKWLYSKNEKPFVQKPKIIDYSKLEDFNLDLFRWKIDIVLWNQEELLRILKDNHETQEPKIAMVWTIAHTRFDDLVDLPIEPEQRTIIIWDWTYHKNLLMRLVIEDVRRLLERSQK